MGDNGGRYEGRQLDGLRKQVVGIAAAIVVRWLRLCYVGFASCGEAKLLNHALPFRLRRSLRYHTHEEFAFCSLVLS